MSDEQSKPPERVTVLIGFYAKPHASPAEIDAARRAVEESFNRQVAWMNRRFRLDRFEADDLHYMSYIRDV